MIDELLPDNIVANLSADLRPEFDREGHLYQDTANGHRPACGGGHQVFLAFPHFAPAPQRVAIADVILKHALRVYQVGSTTAIEMLLLAKTAYRCYMMTPATTVICCPLRRRFRLVGAG